MRCLRCGYPKNAHCRADGSCTQASCAAFVDKWPEEAPPAAVTLEPAVCDARQKAPPLTDKE
jgi:hypothetical protein